MDVPLVLHRSLAPVLLRGWQAAYSRLPLCGRRGATTVLFACCAIALAGVIGLATEAGNWYLMKCHGQNATVPGQNGFTTGSGGITAAVQAPPWNGSHTVAACATEAQTTQVISPVFAGRFVSGNIAVNSVVVVEAMNTVSSCIGVDAKSTGSTAIASPANGAAALTAGRALV